MKSIRIHITPRQVELAESVARDLQRGVGLAEHWTSARAYLDARSRLGQLKLAESHLGIDLRQCRVLEIGSGMGLLVTVARALGIDCVGCEPAANSYMNLRQGIDEMLGANDLAPDVIRTAAGEALPFDDGQFDVVLAFQVLEHVADPKRTLAEVARVLRPGGMAFMDMPNHFSYTEGHFGLPWAPPLAWSRWISRAYVSCCGRNPAFLDELNLVTPWRLRRWAKMPAWQVEVRPPGPGPSRSPSTENVTVDAPLPDQPALKAGCRFGPFASMIRQIISSRRGRAVLARLGMTDHLILVTQVAEQHLGGKAA
jgi:SAM-dependent methyltransferase